MTVTTPSIPDHAMQALELVPFAKEYLPGALRLSAEAGWPHRAEDWALNLAVSEGVVALVGDEVMGTALCTNFGDVAALNMIIVDARMRDRGLGARLMAWIIACAGARELRLVATVEGLPLYTKLGFVATGRIVQHQGTARAAAPCQSVSDGRAEDCAALAAMDMEASGMSRAALIAQIIERAQILRTEGGFALLRDFGRGRVLGPVVARDAAGARALIAEAATRCAGTFLRIDLPEVVGLSGFVEDLGLTHVGGGTAMVCSARTQNQRDFTTYGLVSQALG
jgi:GNAT superfamily N-acetyltransferase